GWALVEARGLALAEDNAAVLVEHYSGNPLALKLVVETICELFGGDAVTFLDEGTPIFGDIQRVLDEHFDRLGRLEQEILIWLAIEREPVALLALASDLVQAPSRGMLLAAMRNLQRRSLLEAHGGSLALQNVVIEYLT